MNNSKSNDSVMEIIAQVIEEMKAEQGDRFSIEDINLEELRRRTGLPRQKLRTLKQHGFHDVPHGNKGKHKKDSVLSGYTGLLDNLLKKGVKNSQVCYERLREQGYNGGITTVKNYIHDHQDLIPARRVLIEPQGPRGIRYQSGPGEAYQMDWGFVKVSSYRDSEYTVACFAMICHHCGKRYIEFFPNAKQENLFIGMIHAFSFMGVPAYVLTDNMKSVVIRRDMEGHPVWQTDYAEFMSAVGFRTKLCKPRHPYTKGKVERLIRFVKDNFLAGRVFGTITDLNIEALRWCREQDLTYQRTIDDIPQRLHEVSCAEHFHELQDTDALLPYLCPERKISFDGFINYEGRRFGVPYSYAGRTARVGRNGFYLYIYSSDLKELLVTHEVTWGKRDRYCKDQYVAQPEELPTAPIQVSIKEHAQLPYDAFDKFDFEDEEEWV